MPTPKDPAASALYFPASAEDAVAAALTYLPDNRAMLRRLEGGLGLLATARWVDRLTERFLLRSWCPASRLWALASESADLPALLAAVDRPMPRNPLRRSAWAKLHRRTAAADTRAREAEQRWRAGFFPTDSEAAPLPPAALRALETERRHSAGVHQALRNAWIPAARRLRIPAIVPTAASTAEVAAAMDGVMARQLDVNGSGSGVIASPTLQRLDEKGQPALQESWLRLPSAQPDGGPHAFAHVYEPLDRPPVATVIHLHGFALEWDQLSVPARDVLGLTDLGVRVIVLEAPWHGRRRRPGHWGGAPMLEHPPLSMVQLLTAQLQELARLTAYARQRWQQPVGWHGVSMGGLTTQLALSRAADWPAACRADAAMLIVVTIGLQRLAMEGAFGRGFGIDTVLGVDDWSGDSLSALERCADPVAPPVCGAERVVLVTGLRDTVTPPPGAVELQRRWTLPAANCFDLKAGHFTAPLHLYRDRTPTRAFIARLAEESAETHATPGFLSP